PLAAPGETLVIVGQFTNFTGGQVGFNVAGRIADPLHQEIENAQLSGVRVAVWSNPIRSEAEAQSLLARSAAWMIIWGEFDSGRVLARFTQSEGTTSPPALESLVASPDDLFATINTALPQEVRYLALLTLGALYADTGDYPRARAVLVRANTTPPQERDAQVTLLFRLGLVHQLGENPQTDETIGYYTQLLQLAPDHLLARYNRGLAYLARNQAGDWDRAVADFDGVIQRSPGYLAARIGRGVAFLYRREPGDEEAALADFGYVIERDDQRPMAFYNRGLLAIRRNNRSLWEGDLLRTIELAPDFAGGYSALCWGYVLDAEAQAALPPCERALALGAQEALHSRSLAYAASGDLALAAADLRAFLAWLDQQPAASPYGIYAGPSAQWLAEMEAG
ncbi:MAG TPA: tetratricopeptide repeat protein, partial [Caldilineaceae bacterium]|nr:tetratricopeptide repeat protein [Caldilineaceae bacterium]